ncbi:type 1 glutamine amidotransferase [Gordonia polyisoprenivorans]|uniref:type 1 glutamine amidotransferase n=1 Tax=Gordonia polyisoprenivorans TaxID=84595 RepID=UPI001AD60BB7|nr:type 1 glutamine amidotransferase [Gordonia polyisoprenivorans]QTI71180.1 type 1 glutamine amidotransferase [Gordonia polyisoprenivorans]
MRTAAPRPRVLVLQHAETEPPGAYQSALDDLADLTLVHAWSEPLPPDPSTFDGIVAMGGGMGVADADTLGWLRAEIGFLRRALEQGVAVWGVCLGSQLLATALGARVYTGAVPEIGIHEVALTEDGRADELWGSLTPTPLRTVQWHFDSFDLPTGAVRLASSAAYANQVFRHGNSYGVQCHLEADRTMVKAWLDAESQATVEAAIGSAATERFPADADVTAAVTAPLADALLRRWLTLLGSAASAPTD